MISYTNRLGKKYHLQMKMSKLGKPRYHFSLNDQSAYDDPIPDGYEIYESPNAQVFLRKILPKMITDLEIQTVKKAIKELADLCFYIIDVKKKCISLFTADKEVDTLNNVLKQHLPPGTAMPSVDHLLDYKEEFQFVLLDKQTRKFQAKRFCYLGSIDDWMNIGRAGQLADLVKQYVVHIGKSSYFELH